MVIVRVRVRLIPFAMVDLCKGRLEPFQLIAVKV